MRGQISELLSVVEREGINELKEFLLVDSDFLTAPASRIRHLAYPGGLAQHSINVTACASRLNNLYGHTYSDETIVLVGLCHDLCKTNIYKLKEEPATSPQVKYLASLLQKTGAPKPERLNKAYATILIDFLLNRYAPGAELPPFQENYTIDDTWPLGHGEKSLFIASKYIELTTTEAVAIRWHMGAWDLNMESPFQKFPYQEAVGKYQLVSLLQIADMEATYFMEEDGFNG